MTAMEELFIRTKAENRAALIGYIPAGFPSKAACIDVIKAMVAGGVDAVEIGFPYSDPVMDGPVIQAAAEQSLSAGTGAEDVFDVLKATTDLGVPGLVMTYWNPIEKYGVEKFAQSLQAAGGSGVITPDLTIEESRLWKSAAEAAQINRIYVVAPSTSTARMPLVTSQCASELVARIRQTSATPVAVGLGVSTKAQAQEVAAYADGVIVGSAFIRLIQESENFETGLLRVQELAAALADGVRR